MAPVAVTPLIEPTTARLRHVAELFDQYRQYYGETSTPGKTMDWLRDQSGQNRLTIFIAELDEELAGVTTTVALPASLRLSHFWQIRDIYVAPAARRNGVARAMLHAVGRAATAAGAIRLSIQTESSNEPALRLYRSSGFSLVDGFESLVQPLARDE